jgi:hypothetical protein
LFSFAITHSHTSWLSPLLLLHTFICWYICSLLLYLQLSCIILGIFRLSQIGRSHFSSSFWPSRVQTTSGSFHPILRTLVSSHALLSTFLSHVFVTCQSPSLRQGDAPHPYISGDINAVLYAFADHSDCGT